MTAAAAAAAAESAAAKTSVTSTGDAGDVKTGTSSCSLGAKESVERLARMALQLSLDLQNGIDYYEHSFDK